MDDVFGGPAEGPVELPSGPKPTGSDISAGVGANKTPGELGMDDVFGGPTGTGGEPAPAERAG